MSKKVKVKKTEEVITIGPNVREGELVFGVAHIFASFNDTFVHVTDLSGRETICRYVCDLSFMLRLKIVDVVLCCVCAIVYVLLPPLFSRMHFSVECTMYVN
eukprot:Colp12_sorted_trinity150504_noHs@12240